MNKIVIKIASIFFFSSTLFMSCESEKSENENCTEGNYEIEVNRFIKKITTHVSGQVIVDKEYNYSYNEFNLLSEKSEIEKSNLRNKYSYNYICNNTLKKRITTGLKSETYEFDIENRLVKFNTIRTFNSDYKLTYEDNLITVEPRENGTKTFFLETNIDGLVTKIKREDNFSTVFEYDVNGNITKAQDFRVDGSFIRGYKLEYDQNPNPYFGQLSSIYLERFISYFEWDSDGILNILNGEDGFIFPYFKNNPIQIKHITNSTDEIAFTREYEYDNENYPIEFSEKRFGFPAIIYTIVYQ